MLAWSRQFIAHPKSSKNAILQDLDLQDLVLRDLVLPDLVLLPGGSARSSATLPVGSSRCALNLLPKLLTTALHVFARSYRRGQTNPLLLILMFACRSHRNGRWESGDFGMSLFGAAFSQATADLFNMGSPNPKHKGRPRLSTRQSAVAHYGVNLGLPSAIKVALPVTIGLLTPWRLSKIAHPRRIKFFFKLFDAGTN
jgi:hypothetical protein